jgi:hypothetical protein
VEKLRTLKEVERKARVKSARLSDGTEYEVREIRRDNGSQTKDKCLQKQIWTFMCLRLPWVLLVIFLWMKSAEAWHKGVNLLCIGQCNFLALALASATFPVRVVSTGNSYWIS